MRWLGLTVGTLFVISFSSSAFAFDCAAYCAKTCQTSAYKGQCMTKCQENCEAKQKKK
jgi:hypothetical protein